MESHGNDLWIEAAVATVASYRRMIDGVVSQLTDTELRARPHPEVNSVAILLRHLGGNLQSRWTDVWTTDGEKPDRDRDREFTDWVGDRESLLAYFNSGWDALTKAISQIDATNIERPVYIRGERHSIAEALMRSLTHVSYHAGQIAMIARLVHEGEWRWLTIPPGASAQHNRETWGTAASRAVLGEGGTAK
ncbi:MAG: DUF1572 family protein [Pirellulales bacterium]